MSDTVATISAVCLSPKHGFSKHPRLSIRLLAGLGVEGDAHCGATVQHLYLKRKNASAPNRMQVHLLQEELFNELAALGHTLRAGDLGENITTRGIDLLTLPAGTRLHVGNDAVVELTCLRTPCKLIDGFQPGLMKQLVLKGKEHSVPARAGVMSVVLRGGEVCAGDNIVIERPAEPWHPLRFL
ncbi:MAG: MOSC domain-containing protein [Janthinobacterium lividum]